MQDDTHKEDTLSFMKSPTFKIERHIVDHRLASNEEIRAIEEKCMREHFDPADNEQERLQRHARMSDA